MLQRHLLGPTKRLKNLRKVVTVKSINNSSYKRQCQKRKQIRRVGKKVNIVSSVRCAHFRFLPTGHFVSPLSVPQELRKKKKKGPLTIQLFCLNINLKNVSPPGDKW